LGHVPVLGLLVGGEAASDEDPIAGGMSERVAGVGRAHGVKRPYWVRPGPVGGGFDLVEQHGELLCDDGVDDRGPAGEVDEERRGRDPDTPSQSAHGDRLFAVGAFELCGSGSDDVVSEAEPLTARVRDRAGRSEGAGLCIAVIDDSSPKLFYL